MMNQWRDVDRVRACIEEGEHYSGSWLWTSLHTQQGALHWPGSDFRGHVYFIRDEIYTESI